MDEAVAIQVDRRDFRTARTVTQALAPPDTGEVVARVDRFGLTANNVSYAQYGDEIGYWGFYPAPDPWGHVPVWGFADVTASAHPDVPVGTRVWGFLPMASHVRLRPGRVGPSGFVDAAPHRQALPGLYNGYANTASDPEALTGLEDARCLLFPLFVTSYVLADYLKDNDAFGARQVVIGSVSSKTGFGLARLLRHDADVTVETVGLTSPGNVDFVRTLDACDRIVTYGQETDLDADATTVFVDMSGDRDVHARLRNHLGPSLVKHIQVGATHWEALGGAQEPAEGPEPEFFFAPGQIAKRDAEWGQGEMLRRANLASAALARAVAGPLDIDTLQGPDAVRAAWRDLLDNRVSPARGLMCRLADSG